MAGYMFDYSMSNNAAMAYENGEKPLSKWTKSEILSLCGEKAEVLKKLLVTELRKELLFKSSWHHTSCKYNCTDFYSFDEDALEEIDTKKINNIIISRQPKENVIKNDEIVKAEITYTIWIGNYKRYKKPKKIVEIVEMKRSDKMVKTSNGNKRVSCLENIRFL